MGIFFQSYSRLGQVAPNRTFMREITRTSFVYRADTLPAAEQTNSVKPVKGTDHNINVKTGT